MHGADSSRTKLFPKRRLWQCPSFLFGNIRHLSIQPLVQAWLGLDTPQIFSRTEQGTRYVPCGMLNEVPMGKSVRVLIVSLCT